MGGNGPAPGPATTLPPAPPPFQFTCNPMAVSRPEHLRKLTSTQYRNTLRDLVAFAVGDPGQAIALLAAAPVAQAVDRVPADERAKVPQDLHGSFRRLDQDLQQAHVDGLYEAAQAVGGALAAGPRLGTLLGACATDGRPANDDGCLTGFIQRFGERALRRPLTPELLSFYRGFYAPEHRHRSGGAWPT